MSNTFASSEDKCTGKGCRGIVNFTQQVRDLISGPNPDIVKASTMLLSCPKCKNLASTEKEKIVTVLALHGVNTLPKKGILAIKNDPKNVRFKLDTTDEDRRHGWQYRCGSDSFDWYVECGHSRCLGIGIIDLSVFFDKLYTTTRAAEGSAEADLTEVFEMCKPCGYGHPNAFGEANFAKLRMEFIHSIMKPCKYNPCNNAGECSMYHGIGEKKRVEARLEAYVQKIIAKANHVTKWGVNENSLNLSEVAAPVTKPAAVEFPSLPTIASKWKASTPAPVAAPIKPITVTVPPVLTPPQVVIKSQVDDDSMCVNDIHKEYIAGLRARATRDKKKKAEKAAEIMRLNKQIETLRVEMDRLDIDAEQTDRLVRMLTTAVTSSESVVKEVKKSETSVESKIKKATVESISSAPVKEISKPVTSIKKKVASKISSPQTMPVLADSASIAEPEPIVDVNLAADDEDELSRGLVILPAVNA